MHAGTQAALGAPLLDFSNAYRLHLNGASVRQAVTALLQSPAVVYASPDFRVVSTQAASIPIPAGTAEPLTAGGGTQPPSTAGVPSNFALASSAQSLLNAPGVDAAAAFDEIDRQFHQLPGQGEIITNVSLGDLDDASVVNNFNDPCDFYATVFGPTTVVIGGQRYLNWPSMPLIPAYTSNQSGQLSGSGEVCGIDPFLGEVGLDHQGSLRQTVLVYWRRHRRGPRQSLSRKVEEATASLAGSKNLTGALGLRVHLTQAGCASAVATAGDRDAPSSTAPRGPPRK
jgi:hypothetical protein